MDDKKLQEELEQFKKYLVLHHSLREITIKNHIGNIKRMLPQLETLNPEKEEVTDFVYKLKQNNKSASHISNNIASIEKYMDYKKNLVRFSRPKRIRQLIKNVLTEAEVSIMIRATKNIREKAILVLLAYSGIRNRSFCNLKLKDVDFGENTIIVRKSKGSKEYITNISSECVKILLKYLEEYPRKSEDYLFTTLQNNNQYTSCALRQVIQKIATRAEINKRVYPHLLRHCVSKDTEILTVNGWKNYNEIKIGDLAPSLNMKSNKIELSSIKNIHKYDYDGEIYNIKNKFIDCILTPEHKMIIKRAIQKQKGSYKNKKRWTEWLDWELISIDDLLKTPNKRLIKHRLNGIIENRGLSIGKSKAGLLGWILTDGCIPKRIRNNNPEISISQSYTANKDKCKKIENLLKDSKVKYSSKLSNTKINNFTGKGYKMMNFRILNESNKWVFDWINNDRTPKWKLLQLKREELEEIYKNIMLGDGSIRQELCTQNKKRIDFFRALCCLIGKRTRLGHGKLTLRKGKKYRTYIVNSNNCNLLKSHIKKIKYKGIVWCPETKNATFIAKRNETIFITGNSLASNLRKRGANIEFIQEQLGHDFIESTMIYAQSFPSRNKSEFEFFKPAYL